ncbi:MAG: hypothetical protein AB7E13_08550 [Arcobacteraceae bacterium]
MPSSLEQIAAILHVKLSREQNLIAANDSSYIAGMKKLGATYEEIQTIRAADRKAQGITPEDEILAQRSIEEAQDHSAIFSLTPQFSAISDKLYDKHSKYVIYNEVKILFYGYNLQNLRECLKKYGIEDSMYYYGGGKEGFLGIKENLLTHIQMQNIIKEIKQMHTNETQLYSYHTFMFPFTFKGTFKPTPQWRYEPFNMQTPREYNEFVYFYKHVQDAIFNTAKEDARFISRYYTYANDAGTYTIESKQGNFTLELDEISLRIFTTGVAVLAFNLKNTKYFQPQDILAINDFGRRIYPQFLGLKNFTDDTKEAILAQQITLHLQGKGPIVEDFSNFDTLETINLTNLLPNFIKTLIEANFDAIRPILDDRMFVISQYNNDALVNRLKTQTDSGAYLFENDDFWYRYLFIDGNGKTCQSKNMTQKLLRESTYDRWVEWGTLFGISRYSFVALTGSLFGKETLLPHMQTLYFQMFTLLLAYRASIIKFADEIQNTTNKADSELANETKKIYKKYLDFLNKLYFKEITAQDQGIELYNKAMQVMEIEKYMKDLDHEINELHNYAGLLEEEARTESMDKISKLGSYLLLPALITSFFGMNVLEFGETLKTDPWLWGIGSAIVVIASGFVMPFILKSGGKK